MKVIIGGFVFLVLCCGCGLCQINFPTHGGEQGSISISFSSTPANNCMVELRTISDETSLGRQMCDREQTQFNGVPRGEYIIVVEEGMQEYRQQVLADTSHTEVTVSLPRTPAKNPQALKQATVSMREMMVPDKARQLFDKAEKALIGAKFDEASKRVSEALTIAPTYARALALKATIQLATSNPNEAIQSADAAVKDDPELPFAQFVRASVLNALGRFPDARSAAERGLLEQTNSWQGHYELAQALNGLNNVTQALQEATKAETYAPHHLFPVHFLRALLLIRNRAPSEAAEEVKELDGSGRKDPRLLQLHQLLGELQTTH